MDDIGQRWLARPGGLVLDPARSATGVVAASTEERRDFFRSIFDKNIYGRMSRIGFEPQVTPRDEPIRIRVRDDYAGNAANILLIKVVVT